MRREFSAAGGARLPLPVIVDPVSLTTDAQERDGDGARVEAQVVTMGTRRVGVQHAVLQGVMVRLARQATEPAIGTAEAAGIGEAGLVPAPMTRAVAPEGSRRGSPQLHMRAPSSAPFRGGFGAAGCSTLRHRDRSDNGSALGPPAASNQNPACLTTYLGRLVLVGRSLGYLLEDSMPRLLPHIALFLGELLEEAVLGGEDDEGVCIGVCDGWLPKGTLVGDIFTSGDMSEGVTSLTSV